MRQLASLMITALLALSFLSCGEESDIVIHVADGTPFTVISTEPTIPETTGETSTTNGNDIAEERTVDGVEGVWALISKSTRKFHLSGECSYAKRILDENRLEANVSGVEYLIRQGYSPCSYCAKQYVQQTETTASDMTE